MTDLATKQTVGRVIQFPQETPEKPKKTKAQRGNNYTSRGVKKASRSDPITNKDDIRRIYEYFMNGGANPMAGPSYRNAALFMLGFTSGLRCGDILNLKIRDLCVNGECTDYVQIYEQKTGKSNRFKIPEQTRSVVNDYLKTKQILRPADFVFTSQTGQPISLNTVNTIFYRLKQDLNLSYKLSSHSMRKTFAYWTIVSHPNDSRILISLQKMFNHSSVYVTMKYAGFLDQSYDQIRDDVSNELLTFYDEKEAKNNA